MTAEQKSEILAQIALLLDRFADDAECPSNSESEPTEMLTIKECAETVRGLSEHTIRLLVARGELSSMRTGAGKHGKILVPKSSLLEYIRKIQN